MYLAIITLPLLGSIVSGFFGRKVGVSGAQLITCLCVIVTTLLAIVAFFEVGLNNIPVSINLFRWIDSESLNVSWGFYFDSLTVAMLIPVLIVSSLVHIYSIGYMSHDPRGCVRGQRNYGDKLSNSGDLLKLKVPSCNRKVICGWTNYSGKVTSLKIGENQMDYRGSKSIILNNIVVKEQWVDDSWFFNLGAGGLHSRSGLNNLRCTLGGFERNRGKILSFRGELSLGRSPIIKLEARMLAMHTSWRSISKQKSWNSYVKIPSKQFDLKKFSTCNSNLGSLVFTQLRSKTLAPYGVRGASLYIDNGLCGTLASSPGVWSGLIDGEGSFGITIVSDKRRKLGWRAELRFQIGLHVKDLNVLYLLQEYLGGIGSIHLARNREIANYSVNSIQDINNLIIHLEKYPLLTQKAADFLLFKQAVKLVENKAHLTVEGLNQIVNIKASMNLGLSERLKFEFPGYIPVKRPEINCDNVILDPNWVSGFVSAEGNFDVRMPSVKSKLGYRVQLRFRISQHSRDIRLMEKIVEYFGSGKIYKYSGKSAVSLSIVDFTDITNIIVPFFKKNSIIGIKLYDYLDWCKIHSLMLNRSHLTVEGIISIREIKLAMNTGRKF
jgi:LAGLIDADG endonuclease/NADH-Ubiquinone oxidoreductase (complex I), chain 5 N-terminus